MKRFISFILTLCLIIFYYSFNQFISIDNFNSNTVKKHIKYLSSDRLDGRLAGSNTNLEAANYIKNTFKEYGLEPFNGSYYHNFTTYYPQKSNDKPYLNIVDENNEIIKSYIYGIDYKEDLLNFRNNKLSFSPNNITYSTEDFIAFASNKGSLILFTPDEDNINFRSSFFPQSKVDMYIMTKNSIRKDIKKFLDKGLKLNCYIPFSIEEETISNVVSIIKGKKSTEPIIISGHFDHLGSDLGGTVYNGALDNASGISFVMEFSKYLKSLGTPKNDIVIIGFNAEEFGCLGAKAFAKDNISYIKNAKVFNFDMIGSDSNVPLSLMGGKTNSPDSDLIKSVANTCSKSKVNFTYIFDDSSDHEAFTNLGIQAITFIDDDKSRIHTPEDKVDFISLKSIDRCFKVASKEVIKQGFSNNFNILYCKELSILSLLLITIISLALIKKNKLYRV
ncbi:M28 family metallopeptidase [Clostridium cochlearium]|uniref:M28 family peptidase n=1 Tax=Clostridium cochlearium TaxID=1494 RepID=A0A7Y3XZG7_CLOCO|nr:M28 family metallopeptidase [Clostridium cochlearium]NOH16719.1 M28 family peptidase [Clostridium cochlearium]